MSPYQDRIRETLARIGCLGVNPRYVEAWMRLEHGTLDSLGGSRWAHEVKIAVDCIDAATPQQSAELAVSYGL